MRLTLALMLCTALPATATPVRVKELADIEGLRDNELFGYGLVVGLGGTGDTDASFFTSQSVADMLGRLGVRVDPRQVRVRNVAAVMVTARLPTFTRAGSRIDVTVSSLGNARSLEGGVLLVTPLSGADGEVRALAQGPVQTGGYQAQSLGAAIRKNQPTTGRVPRGGVVERPVQPVLGAGPVVLALKTPDFTTAGRLAAAVNAALGGEAAHARDAVAVEVNLQLGATDPIPTLMAIEGLLVEVDQRAKVVVSERTGTVVAGEGVVLRPVVVAHGGLEVSVASMPVAAPSSVYQTGQVTEVGSTTAQERPASAVPLPRAATVEELARALNLLGVGPRDLVAILQAIRAVGALDADLEVL